MQPNNFVIEYQLVKVMNLITWYNPEKIKGKSQQHNGLQFSELCHCCC